MPINSMGKEAVREVWILKKNPRAVFTSSCENACITEFSFINNSPVNPMSPNTVIMNASINRAERASKEINLFTGLRIIYNSTAVITTETASTSSLAMLNRYKCSCFIIFSAMSCTPPETVNRERINAQFSNGKNRLNKNIIPVAFTSLLFGSIFPGFIIWKE